MSKMVTRIYGVDLGTAYSSIAYLDKHGKAIIIPNAENQRVTPSAVFFDEDSIVVGDIAKENAKIYPDEVVSYIKRAMGDPNYLYVHKETTYRPEEISSFIIRKVVQDAEKALNEKITDLVITCPAYFGINEREATQRAGEIAGYTVRHILNEPTAAAIAYGAVQDDKSKTVLVYDLGGGTFDITMIAIEPDTIEVICTGGDHNLGGKDWDDCIVSYLAEEFNRITGIEEDILDDPDTCQDLLLVAEKSKKILGQRHKTPVVVTYGGQRVKVELTREKFMEITESLLERTIAFTSQMLQKAQEKGYQKFDEIILVGGATRMPEVAKRIEQEFVIQPKIFDPDEAVAKGAAIYGAKLSINDELFRRIAEKTDIQTTKDHNLSEQTKIMTEAPKEILEDTVKEVSEVTGFSLPTVQDSMIRVKDVSSKSFGLVVNDPDGKEQVYNLIQKNTAVPCEITQIFMADSKNPESVIIRIMENEENEQVVPIEQAVEIGTASLTIPPGLPDNAQVQIEFKLNEEGRLIIRAMELSQQLQVDVAINTQCVIQGEEVKKSKDRFESLVIQ